MTRDDFFARLESRLNVLNEKERRDIIDEYKSHIEFKMQDGKTEAEAIADFGDVDALAEEILSAYHIDSENVWNKNGEYYIKKSVNFINSTTERLLSFSLGDMAKVVVEFLVVLGVIVLISIPFNVIGDELVYYLGYMPSPVDDAIGSVIRLAFDIVNLIIAFIIIYSFAKTRILERKVTTPVYTQHNYSDEANFDVNTGEPLKKTSAPKEKRVKDHSVGSFVISMLMWILKLMLFVVVWLPSVILTIFAIVATVLLSVMMVSRGIGLWGICIIGAGCCIMGIGFTAWTTQILFGGSKNG